MSSSLLAASFCVVKVLELLCGETDEFIQPYRYPEDTPAATKNTVIAIHMEISCDSEHFRQTGFVVSYKSIVIDS